MLSASSVVEPGSGVLIAQVMNQAGIHVHADGFIRAGALFRARTNKSKAGAYEVPQGFSPALAGTHGARRDGAARLTLVEGGPTSIRQTLQESPAIRQTLNDISDTELLNRLGAEYPSQSHSCPTPTFLCPAPVILMFCSRPTTLCSKRCEVPGRTAVQTSAGLALRSPDLASIIEKETGAREERARAASSSINLRIGMLLQTDPTVMAWATPTGPHPQARSGRRHENLHPWRSASSADCQPGVRHLRRNAQDPQ